MRLHYTCIALSFIGGLCACGQAKVRDSRPTQQPAPAKVIDPIEPFARMVGGEWKMSAAPGTDLAAGAGLYDIWHWGPGKHSLRVMTDGLGGDGSPWRALQVVYWHPGRKQVRSLALSTFRAGVAEGTIRCEGKAWEAVIDMYQTGDHRNLKSRWTFDCPDKYLEELMESTGAEYFLLAAWNRSRVELPTTPRSRAVEGAPKPSEHLKAFKSFLHHTWEAKGDWATGGALHIQSTVEWVPLANGIYVRTLALSTDAEPAHILDAYVYHHTGANSVRCLALSNRGGVYEGNVTLLDGGALRLDLQGYDGDKVISYVARIDFEKDGTVRQRVWLMKGAERTPLFDAHHKALKPKKG